MSVAFDVMEDRGPLPFKKGQLAESRSFTKGFRGAWFRCKIHDIQSRKSGLDYALEFYDFSDEKLTWTRAYQYPQRTRRNKPELMLRPQYPPVYSDSEVPDANAIPEVTVVRSGVWKVGDEVDWFTDGCYWSGRVIKIISSEKVQIEFPLPPAGEGSSYVALCKDLRPSLDWSPKHGWSVPVSKGGENRHRCARLIEPVNPGLPVLDIDSVSEAAKDFMSIDESSSDSSFSLETSSLLSPHVDKLEGTRHGFKANVGPERGFDGVARTSFSDSVSTSHLREASAQTNGEDEDHCSGPSKRMRTGECVLLNSMRSDTLEAAVLDLEELVHKVKWLKRILECGTRLSDSRQASWKFIEHRASSTEL